MRWQQCAVNLGVGVSPLSVLPAASAYSAGSATVLPEGDTGSAPVLAPRFAARRALHDRY